VYIGITGQDVSKRWRNGYGYQRNEYFWRAIQKYGWQNIKHEILFDSLTKEQAEAKEIELIEKYNSTNPMFGYNLDNGGNSIGKRSEATKLKISLKNKGKHRTKEANLKNAIAHKGSRNANYGKHFSEEHRRKIGDAQRGGKHPFAKTVIQFDKQGVKIKVYSSTTEAEKETGISRVCISGVCNGKQKTAGGYRWSYADEMYEIRSGHGIKNIPLGDVI
jgi:group I intron endonuclease